MNIQEIVNDKTKEWDRRQPGDEKIIRNLINQVDIDFPNEYLEFLKLSNGGEGELGIDPGWFQIYKAEDVIEINKEYEMEEFHPGYFGFGTSLGGIMFAFNLHESHPKKIYGIPFDSIDPDDIYIVSQDFLEFAEAMGGVWEE